MIHFLHEMISFERRSDRMTRAKRGLCGASMVPGNDGRPDRSANVSRSVMAPAWPPLPSLDAVRACQWVGDCARSCGQIRPGSRDPELQSMEAGIGSLFLDPDIVIKAQRRLTRMAAAAQDP